MGQTGVISPSMGVIDGEKERDMESKVEDRTVSSKALLFHSDLASIAKYHGSSSLHGWGKFDGENPANLPIHLSVACFHCRAM